MQLEKNIDGELARPLIVHYRKIKTAHDRMLMISALRDSLENEDVLLALNTDVYKALLNFLLRAFAREKEFIERESVAADSNMHKE